MSRTSCRRWCVAVCLIGGLVLIPGRVLADKGRSQTAKAPVATVPGFWSALTNLWQEAGCLIDPSGACVSEPEPVTLSSDAGCIIDPNGTCIVNR
jgi:hypothetical protein